MAAKRGNGVVCPPCCERFLSLDRAEFERTAAEAIARLGASNSGDDAKRIYDNDVLPLEMERIRREAVRGADKLDLLFVTVGAQASSPTLAALASPARFVVLLHTVEEKASADATIRTLELDATEAALQCIDDGKDSARLYRAVFDEWSERGRPEKVGIDITGGLKVMSAAAAAAAFSFPHGNTYYIDAERLRLHGREWWVSERRIELANPFRVFGELRRTTGRELLKTRRYAAAAGVYGQLYEEEDRSRAQLADGYDALERLDFERAAKDLAALCDRVDVLAHNPQRNDDAVVRQRESIRANAEGARRLLQLLEKTGTDDPLRNTEALRSPECLELGEMLLARAEHAAPDVAALLAYRCLELVPQRRLALRGKVNPSAVDWEALAEQLGLSVAQLIDNYNKASNRPEHHLDPKAPPSEISSAVGYGLLAVAFPGDVTKELTVARFAGAGAARHRSVLAHGLQQLEKRAVDDIRTKARKLFEALLDVEQVSTDDRAALRQRHAFVEVE